jgi:hypothetical protein
MVRAYLEAATSLSIYLLNKEFNKFSIIKSIRHDSRDEIHENTFLSIYLLNNECKFSIIN